MNPLIYVAGRYRAPTREAVAANIAAARAVGVYAASLGWYPCIPHVNTAHFEDDLPDLGDEFWLAGTLELMSRCDAVVLVDGWETSLGTAGEIQKADALMLPVYRGIHLLPSADEFITWLYALEERRA